MAMACDARFLELAHGLADAFLVERLQHLARGGTSRSVTVLRCRRLTSGRLCHGMSCMIE